MSIIRKNLKRYLISLLRSFLGGALAYIIFMLNGTQTLEAKALGALLTGAVIAGIIGVLKVLQESTQAIIKQRTGQTP